VLGVQYATRKRIGQLTGEISADSAVTELARR
jgi:hypothetical protein